MTRYRYNDQLSPRAPFVSLALENPGTGVRAEGVPARIDTAADRTVGPWAVKDALGLAQIGEQAVAGLGGKVSRLAICSVLLTIQQSAPSDPVEIEVFAVEGEPVVLLGRDVLNRFRIVLDGPGGYLEIG